jgi:hypothetical protein
MSFRFEILSRHSIRQYRRQPLPSSNSNTNLSLSSSESPSKKAPSIPNGRFFWLQKSQIAPPQIHPQQQHKTPHGQLRNATQKHQKCQQHLLVKVGLWLSNADPV